MVATQPYVEQILLNRLIREDIDKMETEHVYNRAWHGMAIR